MKGINVNPRRDFVSARYGKFASSANKSSFGAGSSRSLGFRRSDPGHESSKNDFMSKLKNNSTPGNVYIPSNGVESINVNNYIENLLM